MNKRVKKQVGRQIRRINRNRFTRNLVLAICSVVVLIFALALLLAVITRHNNRRTVPDFKGLSTEEAYTVAKRASLRLEIADSLYVPAFEGGMVLEQTPAPNTTVKSRRRIFLTVNSHAQRMVRIPYVTGFSLRQAKNNLEVAGLEIARIIYRSDMATNYVLEQRYEEALITATSTREAPAGSGVTLHVGLADGAIPPAIPKVIGFPLREAKSRLWELGFNVGTVTFDEGINLMNQHEARVYEQSRGQGVRAAYGSAVNMRLTLDEDKVDRASTASDRAARALADTVRSVNNQ